MDRHVSGRVFLIAGRSEAMSAKRWTVLAAVAALLAVAVGVAAFAHRVPLAEGGNLGCAVRSCTPAEAAALHLISLKFRGRHNPVKVNASNVYKTVGQVRMASPSDFLSS